MALSTWLRPPRNLVVLFLGITLVLMGTLGWLGVRLFRQDRALERQRVQDRLERAADVVATELFRVLRSVEDRLSVLSAIAVSDLPAAAADYALQFSEDAVLVVFDSEDVEAYPPGRLFYYPVAPSSREPDASVFARGESYEFRDRNFAAAARVYRRLASSADSSVRAAALLRLARTERKAGDSEAALEAFEDLATLGSTPVGGLPAELVARAARLDVLQTSPRDDEQLSEAESLYVDLHSDRWSVTRAQYEFYSAELCSKIPCDTGRDTALVASLESARALAGGVERLWERRSATDGGGHEVTWLNENPVQLMWQRSGERTVALVGGRQHLESHWLAAIAPSLDGETVQVALADVSGNALTTPLTLDAPYSATRSSAASRLPWTLHVASSDPQGDFAQLAERRRLLLLGLATLALLLLVGLYAVTRGVTRELEAARLQSDFVSAVSHEFRTPLTSLKQLAELLSSGRVTSEDRRARYYQVMEQESGRLHRLVEGLLDFGRMEAGALEFNKEKASIRDLVRDVVADFEAEIADQSYAVELSDHDSRATALVDVEALRRAVWNLLDNAAKYSPDCQTVWVDVTQEDGHATIAVRDEGVGIPSGELETVFNKFVRGTSSDGRGTKGTGIGLAMVRHIVEAHGGEVRVESEVGRGSTFIIQIPVEE
jgi:signal transduction histidine kinase